MSLTILTLRLGNLPLLPTRTHHWYQTRLNVSVLSHSLLCSSPLSNMSSSPSFAFEASFHSCCTLDLCLRRNFEKRPRICMLESHSVQSSILSPSIVQTVRISFATCSGFSASLDIKFLCQVLPDVLQKLYTCTSLMKSPSHGKLWSTCQGFCGHCNQFKLTFTL